VTPEPRGPAEYAAFAGMSLIWGSTFLAIRFGNDTIPALWGATLRLILAASLLFVVARMSGAPLPKGHALWGAALFGFMNLGINFSLLYWGEQRVPSGIAAVLYATVPLTAGVFAWIFGLERLQKTKLIAAVIGLAGVALIFAGELKLGAPAVALLAVFLGATIASLSTIVLKRTPSQSPFMTNSVGALAGIPVCLLGSLLLHEPHPIPSGVKEWWPILYLVVAGNLGAYVLYAWLVSRWNVTTVSTTALIVPVLAVLLGSLVRGESPAPEAYLGGLIVLVGVTVALRVGRR
jgi:drug/metabolite transporter (DMT)-like permease